MLRIHVRVGWNSEIELDQRTPAETIDPKLILGMPLPISSIGYRSRWAKFQSDFFAMKRGRSIG